MLDATKSTATATFHAESLRKAVALAAQAVDRWNTIPILGMIRITATADAGVVRGTDLDIEMIAFCDVIEASGTVDFTIGPRLLANLLRWAGNEILITQNGEMITMRIDDVEVSIREICNAETDWPAMIPFVSDQTTISEAVLQRAIAACSVCISREETRYYLNGVYWHQVEGQLCLVATDGHRMARYQTAEAWPFAGQIVPRKAIQILQRLLRQNGNGSVTAMAAPDPTNAQADSLAPKQPGNRVEFRSDGWKLISKTIDGTFPDYTRVIPQAEPTITATITHHALRRFGDTNERSRAVKIDPVAGRMTFQQPDGPTISMPVQSTGEKPVGFNLDYLRQLSARAGTIRLEMKGPDDPARILTDDPALLNVLMPMRV